MHHSGIKKTTKLSIIFLTYYKNKNIEEKKKLKFYGELIIKNRINAEKRRCIRWFNGN
jgi:hypothetical protein